LQESHVHAMRLHESGFPATTGRVRLPRVASINTSGHETVGEPRCRLGAVARRATEKLIFKAIYLVTTSSTGRPSTFPPG
jgi:hypothetical protein